ncbi:MAG TPA: GspE/PulE family protein, partial [Candidatus Paceibacterota bacterium]|nr:GspE/PulE family protein [Candidatus Paceibacterota bacterium]
GLIFFKIKMAKDSNNLIPKRDIGGRLSNAEVLKYVPVESATYYKFAPIDFKDGVLEFGITDPDSIEARDAISFTANKYNLPYKIFQVSESDFRVILDAYKEMAGEVHEALQEFATTQGRPGAADIVTSELMEDIAAKKTEVTKEDAPMAKIVSVIIQNAVEGNASDIHIEPGLDKVKVRFRMDGVLHTSLMLPMNIADAIVARIKILTNMKLDEKRIPQDGRFSANIAGRQIDFRVSTFPTYFGEKVVMRILDFEKGVKKIESLGFSAEQLQAIKEALNAPYGLILLTGPTGSGKTTTLYSMLNEVDREENNVVSLEDPVEYNIQGVAQSQVRPEIDYTFASGLRSILRQDPDIIMVGEIRDAETARLAIQAALTGHLVFSTLHTNTAVAAIPRLMDMGIEPYLIAPTLILVIAQRLVGSLCEESKGEIPVTPDMKEDLTKQFADLPENIRKQIKIPNNVYTAKPSATCATGTRGRTPVLEVLQVDREMQNLIFKNPSEEEVRNLARSKGMLTMKEDAMLKAFDGEIGFEEVDKL